MTERRLRVAILGLSLLGAGIAAYLTVAHLAHVQLACATGGCETVQTSRYAEIGGVPVAALGLGGYLVLAASALRMDELARLAGFAVALAGVLFAGYLVYVQAAVLDAWCQWCLASDALLLLLAPTTLLRAVRGDPPGG
jgi:uncharacterized membrane protein